MSDGHDRDLTAARSPFRRAREVAAVALPLAVWAAGAALVASWRPELPMPVAVHWGTDGADGFAAPLRTVLLTGIVPALGSLGTALVLRARRVAAPERRLAAGSATGISVFCVGLVVGSIAGQRGLADPATAPSPTLAVIVAGLLAVLAGAAAARLLPGTPPGEARASSAPPETAPRLSVAPGERAVWSGRATMEPVGLAVLGTGGLVLGGLVLLGIAPAPLLLALALLLVVGLLFGSARVWVDERGLTVRSPLGRPAWQVPLADIAEATVVDVRPLREFGGWGYRVGRDGRRAVVLRGGAAVEVVQGDGRRFAVTVPGARQAAALLNTLATRQRT
ncbi:hypothetical protein O2W15_20140 [Modestobacter sp. VKM Ac-2979]|uniref:hypothetical protein n=1 Tax=unclassified Modestobacter TaxID=2643866 RepID=UPI0022AB67B5|nr:MULTISPECIES: hypothetical protein [unclassified Modestobacter]MCZ2813747.1 hypothetical protein [Modestobacter sp. VKM Ac-2979]MCZ2844278.1 hypothetical protein [Modestobacter sp. VKM Ac-2980]